MSMRFLEKIRGFCIVTFLSTRTMFQKFVIHGSSLVLAAITSAGRRSSIDGEVPFIFNPFRASLLPKNTFPKF
jgi:hypothetical protein